MALGEHWPMSEAESRQALEARVARIMQAEADAGVSARRTRLRRRFERAALTRATAALAAAAASHVVAARGRLDHAPTAATLRRAFRSWRTRRPHQPRG